MAVQNVVRNPDYSDLDLDFISHPTTKDVVRKTGVDAIKRSVRNLILTNFYDRKFRHYIGSNTQRLLFDNINILTANFIQNSVIETIRNYEPRVQLIDNDFRGVEVIPDIDNNGFMVKISFIIINRNEPATINIFLERIR